MPSDPASPERLWFAIRRTGGVMERRAEAVVWAETHTASELAACATDDPRGARAAITALDHFASSLKLTTSGSSDAGGDR